MRRARRLERDRQVARRSEDRAVRLGRARTELADLVARRLRETLPTTDGPHVVAAFRAEDDLGPLRTLAGRLSEDPRIVALVAATDEGGGLVLVVQRGMAAKLDCGAFFLSQAGARGGRGGGRPERAERRFPKHTAIDTHAEAARAALI